MNMIENLVRENNNFYFSKILTEIEEDEPFKIMIKRAKTDKIQAFTEYSNLISSCSALNEQMILFTEKFLHQSPLFRNQQPDLPKHLISPHIDQIPS